jgi:hypothetical protein
MMHLAAEVDEAAGTVRFTATRTAGATEAAARLEAAVDGIGLATLAPGEAGPVTRDLPFEALRAISAGQVTLQVDGAPAEPGALATEGTFFEAIALPDAARFHEKAQLHPSRDASPLLLELAARCAHDRFPRDAVTRAAALTILAHRHIERLQPRRSPEEEARIHWLLARAQPLVAQAGARFGATAPADAPPPAWQDVRWAVSLAMVAGHLHMARGEYAAARDLFALPRHCVQHVGRAKVSALNMVVGCFLHGVLSHILGDEEAARDSLDAGIQGVRPMVEAQDVTDTVWVIGDLIDVMRVARQCAIARVRLGLVPPGTGPAAAAERDAVFTLAEVHGPLAGLVARGLLPRLRNHILRHGGR